MKPRDLVILCAACVLSGCGGAEQQPAPAASLSAAAPASAAPAAPAASLAKGDQPTREFLVGKWGTNGDCALAMDLRADGTSDGPFGNWNYADGVITFADAPGLKVTVKVIDKDTMESVNENPGSTGKTQNMTRCP